MKEELNNIILGELDAVNSLLKALEEQHENILKNDALGMEASVNKIDGCNKSIAEWEVKRRKLINGDSMSQLVREFNDEDIESNYRKIKRIIEETIVQKDMNELLIKQGLGYTTRLLNILNPDRAAKTYNSYGKVAR